MNLKFLSQESNAIDAVVPAHNEELTVGAVVKTLISTDKFRQVVVVDDGSSDGTAKEAEKAGARVVQTPRNLGKGSAMLFAVESLQPGSRVGFFDADLIGLRTDHVLRMVQASDLGYDMVCGLRDYGLLGTPVQLLMPLITGDRILKRWVLESLPQNCWDGYSIETAMNDACTRGKGRVYLLLLDKITQRNKIRKLGLFQGTIRNVEMLREIWRTDRALEKTHGMACSTD
jgi:polyisoprenyl-phosphate glycosyltransferase